MTGALIIDIAYGFDVQREDDPWLAASEKAMHGLIQMGKAGAYLGQSPVYDIESSS